jgi:hypothetical protein
MKRGQIIVQSTAVALHRVADHDYISLTDIARFKNPAEPKDVVKKWLRSRSTIEFLGLWERINNPGFKGVDFDAFLRQAGANSFTLSPAKWIEATSAVGLRSSSGRNGGTYAHPDIAFEFAAWVSAEFKLYLIREFQRLQQSDSRRQSLEWDLSRTLSKINYRIHTDAIAENLIPASLSAGQAGLVYSSEADVLNMALFGLTAAQWRANNPGKRGNVRDYAAVEQLVVLSNLESLNAEMIRQGLSQSERLLSLNRVAITQMRSILNSGSIKKLRP